MVDGWQVATKRRGRRAPAKDGGLHGAIGFRTSSCQAAKLKAARFEGDDCCHPFSDDVDAATEEEQKMFVMMTERVEARVREQASRLRDSDFFRQVRDSAAGALERARESLLVPAVAAGEDECGGSSGSTSTGRLLCLGVGSTQVSQSSVLQLALAWLLAESLGLRARAWSDPQMRPADRSVGLALGFKALPPATALKEYFDEATPTLLFMPHCDRALYEGALAGGSDSDRHRRLAATVILGNSFRLYVERDELRVLPSGSPGAPGERNWIREVEPMASEWALPSYAPCEEAFNDLSLVGFVTAGRHVETQPAH